MLETLDGIFQGFIGLGGPAMMFIVLTLLALAFRVRLPKALEGGFRMAIALMGMISVINPPRSQIQRTHRPPPG